MNQTIRVAEVDPVSGEIKEPKVGANGSVELFRVPEPLAGDIMRFINNGTVDNPNLHKALTETRRWFEALARRHISGQGEGVQGLTSEYRVIIAAQCLRMQYHELQVSQMEGSNIVVDHELHWSWTAPVADERE